ncbi:MAG: glucose-6-phosphate dehydrogenase [Mariprofundaceae bacterium]
MSNNNAEQSTHNFLTTLGLQDNIPEAHAIVVFGASGDLTKRLLMPSIFHLYCSNLLPEDFVIVGVSMDDFDTKSFREKMDVDVPQYSKSENFNLIRWNVFCQKISYIKGSFDDACTFEQLDSSLHTLRKQHDIGNNILFYMATPPVVFGMISQGLEQIGLNQEKEGWRRIIVEKPFGKDTESAHQLNSEILKYWQENQIYRIDHYLGKETVQNILAFRFANAMFESSWNHVHIDHIQITATETVGVEWRGGYYDQSGVMRDMIQNHLFQVMAYLCMEPPTSFEADAIRNEKYKLLSALRILKAEDVNTHAVRGQYGEGFGVDSVDDTPSAAKAYRQEHAVDPESNTETYAALKLNIDNARWQGVPIFLCSGKALCHKTTEIVVHFRHAPGFALQGSPAADQIEGNELIFRIQPDEGIEFRFLAKRPGPSMHLRKVNMNFKYEDTFVMQPGTGYETMLYDCMHGDASLFSRTDWVNTAWKIVQPVLDEWAANKDQSFPNYPAGSWGPKAAFDLLNSHNRRWHAPSPNKAIQRAPMFNDCGEIALQSLAMMLKPVVFDAGDIITLIGTEGREFFIIESGTVEIINAEGTIVGNLGTGQTFSELSLLMTRKRRATVRALTYCALYIMEKNDFYKVLMDRPQFADHLLKVASERYNVVLNGQEWIDLNEESF